MFAVLILTVNKEFMMGAKSDENPAERFKSERKFDETLFAVLAFSGFWLFSSFCRRLSVVALSVNKQHEPSPILVFISSHKKLTPPTGGHGYPHQHVSYSSPEKVLITVLQGKPFICGHEGFLKGQRARFHGATIGQNF